MSRNNKVSKEVKIQACEDYSTGKGSYRSMEGAFTNFNEEYKTILLLAKQ